MLIRLYATLLGSRSCHICLESQGEGTLKLLSLYILVILYSVCSMWATVYKNNDCLNTVEYLYKDNGLKF